MRALKLFAPAGVLIVAVLASLQAWIEPVEWSDPDALYYQAKTLSFRGEDENEALHEAFDSPLADQIRREEREAIRVEPERPRHFSNPEWIDYSTRFFHRRVLVSLMAAGIYPLFELRSVLTISLLGYLLLSLALFALLRRRFGPGISAVVAAICILAPPLRDASFVPMTDSWGLALETLALLSAVLFLDRGDNWLAAWIAAMAALSVTRDDSVIPLVAAGCLFLHQRDRRSLLLLATGAAAILPAVLILGNTSIKENLAFAFNGFNPPVDNTWKFVLHYYPLNLRQLLEADADYGRGLGLETPLWFLGLGLVAYGVGLMLRRLRAVDPYYRLMAYSLLGAVVYVGLFGRYSAFRQEITFLPGAAVAVALVADVARRARPRGP